MFSPRFPREQHGSLWELTLSKEMLQTWFNTLGLTDREPATVYRGVCCDGHALRTSKNSKIASRFLRTHSQITWEMTKTWSCSTLRTDYPLSPGDDPNSTLRTSKDIALKKRPCCSMCITPPGRLSSISFPNLFDQVLSVAMDMHDMHLLSVSIHQQIHTHCTRDACKIHQNTISCYIYIYTHTGFPAQSQILALSSIELGHSAQCGPWARLAL